MIKSAVFPSEIGEENSPNWKKRKSIQTFTAKNNLFSYFEYFKNTMKKIHFTFSKINFFLFLKF